ncbi:PLASMODESMATA CALLOSE-BINDING PROTEIN 1-like isoform X2 [Rhododendron vialii]|uniref:PLASMODESMATA CALLOSE-BINDING PROTEIN 1-like isoform X2 n=1 Tax=Rhododendron vialii TaxID=182163 RepID=UPI00265D94C2|nr:PLASMODESMATA CALLOSE-BINDING PROTEIN 1-like isoform X2 [Rhododendron vialii]
MAAVVVLCLVTFLAMAGHSTATYCICKDGLSDSVLQTDIDYACANGADCSHILQNGSCYNPVTVKDHCNYAVNSYYQRKNQVSGSCDFSGTAITTQAVPNQISGCVYPSSPSTAGNTSTTPSLSPSTSPTTPSVFGLGPTTGSGSTTNTNNKATVTTLHQKTLLFWSLTLTLLLSGPLFSRA